MKKILLLAALTLSGITAWGEGYIRETAPDLAVTHVSPNGRYVVSELYGYLEIFDLETGGKYSYYGDEDAGEAYSFGMGNSMSDVGVGVGSYSNLGGACVWENGEWSVLPVLNPRLTNLSRGITPDAKRICGTVGNQPMSTETDGVMSIPCIWERQEDGTYAGPTLLPRPAKDFTGRTPQYITAIAISDDGRTIAGQVRDYSGMMIQPIVYREDENGEWSYETLFPELFNPDGIVLPEDPGEAPQNAPNIENFMTAQELAAYNIAVSQWEMAGGTDWSTYPDMEDFMTQEEIDAFYAAVDAYNKEIEEWYTIYIPYQEALNELMSKATCFLFNDVYLSPDGKVYASATVEDYEDPSSWTGFTAAYRPCVMYLDENIYKPLPTDKSMIVSCITSDYTVLANTDGITTPKQAYICLKGESDWERLDLWLKGVDPELGDWFVEQTSHDVDVTDADGMPAVLENYVCSGVAICTPDMSLFATYAEVLWDSAISYLAESYIFSLDKGDSVTPVELDGKTIDSVRYYSLDGLLLPETPTKGLTIRQTIYTDGTAKTEKVIL